MPAVKWTDRVQVASNGDGSTSMFIPGECFWECVEWLHARHIDAEFTFKGSCFAARLPEISEEHAWRLLEAWKPQAPEMEEGSVRRRLRERFVFV